MKLIDFLRNETEVTELCVIRKGGWIVATCWIDDEDLFYVPSDLRNKEVKEVELRFLPILDGNTETKILCRHIYV